MAENSRRTESLEQLIKSLGAPILVLLIIKLNIWVQIARLHEIIPGITAARLPAILAAVGVVVWLFRAQRGLKSPQICLLFFLLFQAVYIVFSRAIGGHIRNDFWAFWTWFALIMIILGMTFPIVAYFQTGRSIRSLINTLIATSVVLAAHAILFNGWGPGGPVHDENDTAHALVSLLPLSLALVPVSTGLSRIYKLVATVMIMAAVVITDSRGGFVGMMCVLTYLFFFSRRKAVIVGLCAFIVLIGSFFVPDEYWDEIKTITDPTESTAESRIYYWTVATRVWLYPGNFLTGVGLSNTPWWLRDFEDSTRGTDFGERSIAGRSVHSILFQMLPDLGVIGSAMILYVFGASIVGSFKRKQEIDLLLDEQFSNDRNSVAARELAFAQQFLVASNASWAGALGAGLFISVLYYPIIWLLPAVSTVSQTYASKLIQACNKEGASPNEET